jgi:hypothetical protein
MTAEYSGGSAIGKLCLEDIGSGMYYDNTLGEFSVDSLLNTNVRPKGLLEFCVRSLSPLMDLY